MLLAPIFILYNSVVVFADPYDIKRFGVIRMVAFNLTRTVPVVHRTDGRFGNFVDRHGFVQFATGNPSGSMFCIGFLHCGFALIALPIFMLFFLAMFGSVIFRTSGLCFLSGFFKFCVCVWGSSYNNYRFFCLSPSAMTAGTFKCISTCFRGRSVGFFSGLYRWVCAGFFGGSSTTRFTSGRVTEFAACVSTEERQFFGIVTSATSPSNLFHDNFLSRPHPSQSDPTKNDQPGWSVSCQGVRRTHNYFTEIILKVKHFFLYTQGYDMLSV